MSSDKITDRGLLNLIKQAAVQAVAASSPVQVTFGKVVKAAPLSIRVDDKKKPVSKDFIVQASSVYGELEKGDRVILLLQQGGQKYIVLDTVGKAASEPGTVSKGGGADGAGDDAVDDVIDNAVAWAIGIAEDNSHGYDQGSRWGPDYDCSSLVIQAWEHAGVPVKSKGANSTHDMVPVFLANGFTDVTGKVNLSSGAGLKKGDVLWRQEHVEMMTSSKKRVGAHSNENGGTTGGKTGDQTGTEISVNVYGGTWERVLRYSR